MAENKKKSKKRSGANSPPKLNIVFFIDRSIAHNCLASSLREAGEKVIVHDDLFPPDTPDDIWLEEAGKNGWVVLTHDTRIRYRKWNVIPLLSTGQKHLS